MVFLFCFFPEVFSWISLKQVFLGLLTVAEADFWGPLLMGFLMGAKGAADGPFFFFFFFNKSKCFLVLRMSYTLLQFVVFHVFFHGFWLFLMWLLDGLRMMFDIFNKKDMSCMAVRQKLRYLFWVEKTTPRFAFGKDDCPIDGRYFWKLISSVVNFFKLFLLGFPT